MNTSHEFPILEDKMPSPYPNTTIISPRAHMTRIETFPGPGVKDTVAIIFSPERVPKERKVDSTKVLQRYHANARVVFPGGSGKGVQVKSPANKGAYIIKQGDAGQGGRGREEEGR